MKKILIANIFGIGDVLFTTPIIANLKKAYPGIEICYLCNGRVKDLIKNDPDIDNIFVYEKDVLVKTWRSSKINGIKTVLSFYNEIKSYDFDAVFDFTLSREFGFMFLLAGIKKRIGFNYKNRGLFLTDKIAFDGFEEKHVVDYYLELLEKINVPVSMKEMQLVPDAVALEWAGKFLKENGITNKPIVAIVPGGGASWGEMSYRKRWDVGNFSGVAEALSNKGCSILVAGDNTERNLCEQIIKKVKNGPYSVLTELPIEHYIAVLSLCDLVLCNDGGPLHIATAMGIKTVSLFGPVDDKVYGPYPVSDKHVVLKAFDVVCRPCYKKFRVPECKNNSACLRNISVEDVVEACENMLGFHVENR